MTDTVEENQETEEEKAVRLAAEAHRAMLADIDAEIERGRWFVYHKDEADEEILTAEEYRIEADLRRTKGKPEEYKAVDPEALMLEAMETIRRAQARMKAVLAKIARVEVNVEQGETERV